MRSDSDSEDGELGGLFGAPDDSEYEFYFVDISIAGLVSALGPSTEVSFHFRYHTGRDICSKMIIDGELTESARPYLISIGMCILPWYWMGFATKAIIVEVDGMTDGMISFFSSLYENVLLEFCERNGVSFPLLRGGTSRPTPAAKPATEHISAHAMEDTVLIPLGGIQSFLLSVISMSLILCLNE